MDAQAQPDLIPDAIDAAAAWLVALDAGTGDPAAFEAWRNADPRHAAAFAQVAATWSQLGIAGRSGAELPALPPEPVVPAGLSRRRWMQAAAGIAAIGLTAGIGGRALARSSADTSVGERRSIRCDDGLRVDLNTDSAIAWRSTFGRHVWLERGEVALDIVDGPAMRLSADAVAVDLAPGRYNARLGTDGTLDLLVLSGRSTWVDGTGGVHAGQRLLAGAASSRTLALTAEDRDRAEGWRRGELVFAGDTLGAAVAEYNRYLTVPLAIDDPEVRDIRLGGRFTSADPADFLAALDASFGIVARREGRRILLHPEKNRIAG